MNLLAALMLFPALPAPAEIEWSPFTVRAGDQTAEAEFGRLKVPENSEKPDGATIELGFVRLKSTVEKPGPPIVYLDGGPGGSGIAMGSIPSYFATFQRLRESGDVILLDQRGVGRTKPGLIFLGGGAATPALFESRESMLGLFKKRLIAGAEYFRNKGLDLSTYNTTQIADDVDALRTALGVPKISIIGFSYGTHLGLSVIRRHGKNLDRAVLIGTEGPDMTSKMPMEVDRQFDRIQRLIDADDRWKNKIPDVKALLRRVIAKLEREPVKALFTPANGPPVEFTIGAYGFMHLILRDLGDPHDFPWFPTLFSSVDQGNYAFLASLANRRYAQYAPGVNLMTFLVDGASGTSPERQKRIDKEAKTALFGDAMNFDFGDPAEFGGKVLGNDFRTPIKTDVPTLFVSGTLDWNTQPHQAEEVRRTFSKSEHIVVENAGHEDMLDNPPVAAQILKFLKGGSTAEFALKLDPPKFLPPPG